MGPTAPSHEAIAPRPTASDATPSPTTPTSRAPGKRYCPRATNARTSAQPESTKYCGFARNTSVDSAPRSGRPLWADNTAAAVAPTRTKPNWPEKKVATPGCDASRANAISVCAAGNPEAYVRSTARSPITAHAIPNIVHAPAARSNGSAPSGRSATATHGGYAYTGLFVGI